MTVAQNTRKLMKPELKAHIEEFEAKINLDENAQLELKANNQILNAKEKAVQMKKMKKTLNQQANAARVSSSAAMDIDMVSDAGSEVNQNPRESRKRNRQEFE